MSRTTAIIVYLGIAATVAALDLWTKIEAFEYLGAEIVYPSPGDPMLTPTAPKTVFPGWFEIEASLNRGAFSGWFYGMRALLLGISIAWVVGSAAWVMAKARNETILVVAIALTAGGAFGNSWDRYFHYAVRDFIKWFVVIDGEEHVWPNFNIADSCIVAGVILILIREYFVARRTKRAEQETISTAE